MVTVRLVKSMEVIGAHNMDDVAQIDLIARERTILGCRMHALTMQEVLVLADRAIERRVPLHIGVVNAAKLVNMQRDEALNCAVLASDIILADGMSVVWASRLLRQSLPERVAGIDLMEELLRRGQRRGYRVYCLGAQEDALDCAVAKIRADFPGVVIAGRRNGYFRPQEELQIVEEINASKADVLLVAMSPPKKEIFLARWAKTMNVPVCHGVGGAFDVLAGKVRRAPLAWQRLGMEWLYRVVQEPRRMWKRYAVTNTLFCGMVARELVSRVQGGVAERKVCRGVARRVGGSS